MPVKKETQYHAWYWIAAIAVMMVIQAVFAAYTQVQTIPYSEFQDDLKAGKIAEVRVSGNYIQGKFKEPDKSGYTDFITTRVDATTAEELSKYNVKFAGAIESTLLRDLLSWLIPIGLFLGVWWFMYRRFAGQQGFGGLMSVGRSKAKVYVETDTKTTFADVAGVDEAKTELQEIVAFLKDPQRYGRLGGRVPKGVLLVGPPGTGKTLLARAVAGEANVPFFSINGSEFVEMFVGVGAARVRDLFEQAHQKAPCIIFIDELDALGRARAASPYGGGHDEKEQTLNQLLSELDGFDTRAGMVRLAAPNRPELLDPHEREVVAHHEMGHTLVALSLPGTDKVHKVSIIPRGIGSLGYTIQRPTEDRFLMTREELENKMAVLLGGRASETIIFGELSTGASDDLAKVSDIARSLVTRYGMTDELGLVVYEKSPQSFLGGEPPQTPFERSYSEATARDIDAAVKAIIDAAFRR